MVTLGSSGSSAATTTAIVVPVVVVALIVCIVAAALIVKKRRARSQLFNLDYSVTSEIPSTTPSYLNPAYNGYNSEYSSSSDAGTFVSLNDGFVYGRQWEYSK